MLTPDKRPTAPSVDDTAHRSLSKADRVRLAMDAWEPSLLRQLLKPPKATPKQRRS